MIEIIFEHEEYTRDNKPSLDARFIGRQSKVLKIRQLHNYEMHNDYAETFEKKRKKANEIQVKLHRCIIYLTSSLTNLE